MPLRRNWPQNFDSNKRNATFWGLKMGIWSPTKMAHGCSQGCTTCGSLVAGLRENGERMRKSRGNGERMRKWREIHFLHFLLFSLFPPSLSISFTKNCLTLSQNVKYGTFVANVTKNLTYYALWEIDLRSNSQRESSAGCEGLHSITF